MISIVLPVFNEEENIQKSIDSISDFFYKKSMPFEIIAVNDGSKDATASVLQQYQGRENINVVTHPKNLGYGAALRSGFEKAKGDLIFFTDSDCQFNIEDINVFLEEIKNYDFIVGYRKNRQDNTLRIFNAIIFKVVAMIFFQVRVKDIDCAFKLFKKEVIKSLPLQERGALINLEILTLSRKKKYTFLELPVSHFKRVSGNPTGGSSRVILRAMRDFFWFWQRMQKM